MASFTGIIYLTTNKLNGKIYIGQSKRDNPYYLGGGSVLKKAIIKHKKINFTKIILVNNIESCDQLNCLEKFYIKLYESNNPLIGYNVRSGGENKAFNHSKEAINKIRQRSLQDDNKLRIREIQKLASIKRIGTHQSLDSKLKMVQTKFGKQRIIEIYNLKEELLHCCNFSPEASEITGVKKSAIRNNLCGLSKSAGNYIFKYKNIK
jgi:hypothetical protein